MEDTLRILVVDDDEVDRMAVHRALKAAGITVELAEAETCAMATEALASQSFDCVFVDYRLPDRDGLALIQDLRLTGQKIPLIVLTGQGDEQLAVEMMKAGASDYLPKSRISPEGLARILRNAIRIYRAELQVDVANRQREQLARQREDFVSRLTHDLRTPLVAADRMLKLFLERAFGDVPNEMEEAIDIMIRSNQNLLHMVNTLLEVYRHDAGEKMMAFEVCNVSSVLQDVIQELTPLAHDKGLDLHVVDDLLSSSEKAGKVMGDCLEIRRLFVNLIGNAIKFTDTGSITVRLKEMAALGEEEDYETPHGEMLQAVPPSWIVIEVQDTGSGIQPDDQVTLFERYRQGNHKRSGSGLGLYLARRIVEAHDGTIGVNSEAGRGSLFTVRFPAKS